MKKWSICCFLISSMFLAKGQDQNLENLKEIKENLSILSAFIEDNKFKNLPNLILNDPQLYNEVWNKVYGSLREKSNINALRNLKIEFKTFQGSDSNKTSLGFSYAWNYDINKKRNTDYARCAFNAKIIAAGNIAFKKEYNPNDFQEAKVSMGRYGFMGGIVKKLDTGVVKKLNTIKSQLADIEDKAELVNSPLWNELTEVMNIRNHYHYDFTFNGGWEGKQDFSKNQITYGLQIRFSAKSYSDKNALAQLNLLDYPFALIRYITGTDKSITPYGAALPLFTFGIDQVKPSKDSARKQLLNNENSYTRFRFETGFRTLVANIENIPIHFNAAYRYFKEFNAPSAIKIADLDSFSYFTCSITGANTYFMSYSYGSLPFNRSDNAVYAIGFKINL